MPIHRFPNALIGRADPTRNALGFAAKEKKSGRNWSKKASAANAGSSYFAYLCTRVCLRVATLYTTDAALHSGVNAGSCVTDVHGAFIINLR